MKLENHLFIFFRLPVLICIACPGIIFVLLDFIKFSQTEWISFTAVGILLFLWILTGKYISAECPSCGGEAMLKNSRSPRYAIEYRCKMCDFSYKRKF